MVSYLDRLGRPIVEVFDVAGANCCHNKGDIFTLDEMVPAPICPFAYYNLTPYIVTLLHDGWFRWVKREKSSNWRRPISTGQFKNSFVNSAFPNEVLVQCPNPGVSIVMGVGFKENGRGKAVTIRVLNQDGLCPMGHKTGDEFEMGEEEIEISPLEYSALFPYMLLSGYGRSGFIKCPNLQEGVTFRVYQESKTPRSGENFDVYIPDREQRVKATTVKSPCRYHSGPAGIKRIAPEGMCLAALHVAYPYGLALLYDANFPEGHRDGAVYVRCPNAQGGIVLEAKRVLTTPGAVRYLKGIAAGVFETIFRRPVDVMDYKVSYTVSSVYGSCLAHHKVGEQFEFNIWNKDELCPASFHSMYPYLFLKSQGISFSWQEREDSSEVSCPDCHGAVYQF